MVFVKMDNVPEDKSGESKRKQREGYNPLG
jgi:hypothetical protein